MQQVRSFAFDKAECQEDADRMFIRDRIEVWFGGVISFEVYVRKNLAQRIEELLQRQGLVPYRVMAVASVGQYLLALTVIVHAFEDGIPARFNIIACWLCICFFSGAIAVGCVVRLADTGFGDSSAGGLTGTL